jgi:ribonuclease G
VNGLLLCLERRIRGHSVSKKIVIDVQHEQTRVAFLEEGELVEMQIEDNDQQRVVGNIYRGKVVNVLPGMQAAFVDIGLERNAFLYVGDINTDRSVFEFADNGNRLDNQNDCCPSIRDLLKAGQEITVQVQKEPIGTKGAKVTTHVTLPGRYMVLMPTMNYVGVSRRIEEEKERQRLKQVAESMKPETMGLIVRTAALEKDHSDIYPDVEFLVRLWNKIKDRESRGGRTPRLLHKDESIIYRTVRDLFTGDVTKLIINDKNQYHKIREWVDFIAPKLKNCVEYFEPTHSIFQVYGIEEKIEKIIQKKVWLKNGGHIIIEPTEALTAIDVNTGKYVGRVNLEDTVLNTNLEAAEEIARQIRLRDLGGIIIIDFIDMELEEHRQQVVEVLKAALKRDRTKTNVLGFTDLGLVEMTRKKVRNRLSQSLLKPCPYCSGTGKVYSESLVLTKLERELESITQGNRLPGVLAEIHPAVARLWIDEDGRSLEILEGALNTKILIRTNKSLHIEDFNLMPLHTYKDAEKLLIEDDSIYTTEFPFISP